MEYLDLLPKEGGRLTLNLTSVTTITFYSGPAPISYLRDRVNEIVRCNPWLEGRLVRRNGSVCVRYSMSPSCESFSVVVDGGLTSKLEDYENTVNSIGELAVAKGYACVDKDIPLFRVVLVRISDTRSQADKFAVVFSMSHVLGDGNTYYSLYGMLAPSRTPYSLRAERIKNVPELIRQHLSDEGVSWLLQPTFILNTILKRALSTPPSTAIYRIDQAWVDKVKKQHVKTPEVPFLSTNDVLCSWIFGLTSCDVGLIPFNMRGRLPSVTSLHAGNYTNALALCPADYASPALVRRAVSTFSRPASVSLPSAWHALTARIALITSWVSFYQHVDLEHDTRHELHLPYVQRQGVAGEGFVLFRPSQGEVCVLTLSRSVPPERFRDSEAVKSV